MRVRILFKTDRTPVVYMRKTLNRYHVLPNRTYAKRFTRVGNFFLGTRRKWSITISLLPNRNFVWLLSRKLTEISVANVKALGRIDFVNILLDRADGFVLKPSNLYANANGTHIGFGLLGVALSTVRTTTRVTLREYKCTRL